MRLLAIDQGTTSTKAYIWDGRQAREIGRRAHRQIRPRAGWVEHDPDELAACLVDLIDACGPAAAAGLANQGETVVAWDARSKRPVCNAIVWQDERTAGKVDELRSAGVEALTKERAGLPLDSYFSATKLRWILDHADGAGELLRAGRLRLGTSDAYFLDRLTGVFATDPSTASRTSLMDIRRLCWDEELCRVFGIPMECLPEIRPTAGHFGALANGTPMVASIVDQQASLYGHGCHEPGDVKITFGTGAFALGVTSAVDVGGLGRGLLPTCAWQVAGSKARYALDGGILTAGAALEWLGQIGLRAEDGLAGEGDGSAIERGLMFVPALAGLGSPYWDRNAKGAWFGLDLSTGGSDLRRAVLEGIALRACQVIAAFGGGEHGVARLAVDGGLTRNACFVRFLANALGRPLEVAREADITAIGVLKLCMAATGGLASAPMQSHRTVHAERPLPRALHDRFERALSLARQLGSDPR